MAARKPTRRPDRAKAPRRAAPPAPARRAGEGEPPRDMERVARARELFWQNVIRELLASLSILSAQRDAAAAPGAVPSPTRAAPRPQGAGKTAAPDRVNMSPILRTVTDSIGDEGEGDKESDDEDGENAPEGETIVVGEGDQGPQVGADPENIFDGRMAIITSLGQRIPIAAVQPVFACGVRGKHGPDWLSTTVECTVFEIRTPGGQAFTLPVHEVHCFHSLTPELLEHIRQAAQAAGGGPGDEAEQPFGFAAFTSLARSGRELGEVPPVSPRFEGE